MAKQSVDLEQREELERIYNPPPPMGLIYQILVCGTMGTFLAVMTVRAIAPNKVPQIIFPEQTSDRG